MSNYEAAARRDAIALGITLQDQAKRRVSEFADTWVVTDVIDGSILARPVHSIEGSPKKVSVLSGIRCLLGDEVLVLRVSGKPVVIGTSRSSQTGFSMLQSTPVIVPPVIRTGNGAWSNTAEFGSLQTTISSEIDPGMAYLIEARVGAYLTSASTGTKVSMGIRIGFSSDTDSMGPWGAGHQLTSPMWAQASHKRIVSSVTSIQVTARGNASAAGTQTIGDGQLDVDITPLYTAGRI